MGFKHVLALSMLLVSAACARVHENHARRVSSDGNLLPISQPLHYADTPSANSVFFDNPARPDGAHRRPVILGLRFKIFVGEDGHPDSDRLLDRHIAQSDALSRLQLGATVRLWRVDDETLVPTVLYRTRYDKASRQTVRELAVDGRVDSMFPNTTDRREAENAGLWPTQPGWFVDEYSLAWSPALEPGRYRADVSFAKSLVFPEGRTPELSIAHDYPEP